MPFCSRPAASAVRQSRHLRLRCAAGSDDSGSETPVRDRIKSTLSGLDALLGIDPEEEERKKVGVTSPYRMLVHAPFACYMHASRLYQMRLFS
jgi:hypothetical protein